MADDNDGCPSKDVMRLGPPVNAKDRLFVRHCADCSIQAGVARVLREGEPIPEGGSIVHLSSTTREGEYEVQELYGDCRASGGPAMVNSDAYRNNWEGIFGKKPVAQA
jgi:hypothetical protein